MALPGFCGSVFRVLIRAVNGNVLYLDSKVVGYHHIVLMA